MGRSALSGALAFFVVLLLAVPASASDRAQDLTARQVAGFDGLNHFADRALTGASVEPPEQGMCVGGGFVLESVTALLAVYDTAGNRLEGPVTLNAFYGYPPAHGPSGFGPQLTDTSCYFDAATGRWFVSVLTLEMVAGGPFAGRPTGVNHVDIAVSQTSDPTGGWSVNHLAAQADCGPGPSLPWVPDANACLGDFPHLGADANGVYVSTNDYGFFTSRFRSASLYAFSKQALEGDTAAATATRFDTAGMVDGAPGFTVWPAQSPRGDPFRSGDLETARGGVELFLSSNAADPVNATGSRTSRDLVVWALSNTSSLASDHPDLRLTDSVVAVGAYSFPPAARQKAGPVPLADCLNDMTLPTPMGAGCWRLLHLPSEPSHGWTEGQAIDTGDTRMQQVFFAGGIVYGALGTAVVADGATRAGLEWFAVRPHLTGDGAVHAQVVNQGYVSSPTADLSFPALAVDQKGTGAITFSLMGPDDYPSAAYVPFDVKGGTGAIAIAAAGAGPDDGYTNYAAAFHAPPRTRWGDYSAATVDGSGRVWMASEYIAQTCTFGQWLAAPFATCGMTRAGAANWSTRITPISLDR